MKWMLWDHQTAQEKSQQLRKALAEAYGRGDMQRAAEYSRKLDALQLLLWKHQAQRCAS